MNRDIKFMEEKKKLEYTLINYYRRNPELTDYSVQRVYQLLMDRLQNGNFSEKSWKTYKEMDALETMLFAIIGDVCDWCMGDESHYGRMMAEKENLDREEENYDENEEEDEDWEEEEDDEEEWEEEEDGDWDEEEWEEEEDDEEDDELNAEGHKQYNEIVNRLGQALFKQASERLKKNESPENQEDDEEDEDDDEWEDDWDDEDDEEWEDDDDDEWDDDWDDYDDEEWEDGGSVDELQQKNEKPLNLQEMLECLRDLEKSREKWTKHGGRKGYLTFLDGIL